METGTRESLYENSRKAWAAGFQLATHANGERAIDRILGVYEQLAREAPRRDPPGHVWGAAQRITLPEPVRSATLYGAYASFEERDKVSIAPGKFADFAVLKQDPVAVDASGSQDIKIERTMLRGKWAYES